MNPIQTVRIGIPFYRSISEVTQACLDRMLMYENQRIQSSGENPGYIYSYSKNESTNKSVISREKIIEIALNTKEEWLLFIDSDMEFPPWTLEEMWKYRQENSIVGAFCTWRKEPYLPTQGRLNADADFEITWMKREMMGKGLYECDGTGMGVTLIDMELLRKMDPVKDGLDPAEKKAVEQVSRMFSKVSKSDVFALAEREPHSLAQKAKFYFDNANGYSGWFSYDRLSGKIKDYKGNEYIVKNKRYGNDYAFCLNAKRHHDAKTYMLSTPRLFAVGHQGVFTWYPTNYFDMYESVKEQFIETLSNLTTKDKYTVLIQAASDLENDPAKRVAWGDYWMQRGLANAFERLGHSVMTVDSVVLAPETGKSPDVTIHLYGRPMNVNFQQGYTVCIIHSNPSTGNRETWKHYHKRYSVSPAFVGSLRSEKLECDLLFGGSGFNDTDDIIDGEEIPTDYPDIAYVGNTHNGIPREAVRDLFQHEDKLIKHEISFKAYGLGWETVFEKTPQYFGVERFSYYDLPKLYAGAKIVLVDHHEDMRRLGFPNLKIFDIMLSGGFVISSNLLHCDELFEGALVKYTDADDLAEKIKYYLTHEDKRQEMIEKGKQVALKYTYDVMVKQILDDILKQSEEVAKRQTKVEEIEEPAIC